MSKGSRKKQAVQADECSMPDCHSEPRRGQRYCPDCHRLYMKAWRAKRRRREQELLESVVKMRRRIVELERATKQQR